MWISTKEMSCYLTWITTITMQYEIYNIH